jgi:hypothetical protein
MRNSRKIKEKLFTKINTLFYVLGWTFELFFHGEYINMVKGHNVVFIVNLMPLTIHHELITFHIPNGYRVGEHQMNNVRSVHLLCNFPFSKVLNLEF